MKKFIYLDIDGVLKTGWDSPVSKMFGNIEEWNKGCVKILNDIIDITGADIIVSSDWKEKMEFPMLVKMFAWQGVKKAPIGKTPYIKGVTMQTLDEFRAYEILDHVEEYLPDKWVAVDDLNLFDWISEEHFVYMPNWNKGIRLPGKKEKIIQLLE